MILGHALCKERRTPIVPLNRKGGSGGIVPRGLQRTAFVLAPWFNSVSLRPPAARLPTAVGEQSARSFPRNQIGEERSSPCLKFREP